jgi:hypothetical protein
MWFGRKTDRPSRRVPGGILALLVCATSLYASPQSSQRDALHSESAEPADGDSRETYFTRRPLEPDNLSSAWLIARHIDPGAEVLFLDEKTEPSPGATAFDLPGARWSRQGPKTTYETVLEDRSVENRALLRIGQLVRASELSSWMLEATSPEGRFDRRLKALAAEDDIESAFTFLDAIFESRGEVPETP